MWQLVQPTPRPDKQAGDNAKERTLHPRLILESVTPASWGLQE